MTQLPPEFLIFYRDEPHILRKYATTAEYGFTCPRCGTRGSIELHPTAGHAIYVEPGADGVTIRPSLVCGTDCGFHVLVDRGIARDC